MSDGVCPQCEGTGWKIVQRAGLSGAERCDCALASRPSLLLANAGIPPRYESASLSSFQIPQDNPIARTGLGTVLMQIRGFVREFPAVERPGLLLVGDTGTGKTHLAVAVLKALIEKGHEGLFFDHQEMIQRIQKSWDSTSGTSDRAVYQSVLDVEVLVLDEIGAHRHMDWVEDTMTAIITHRCNHRKSLIVTTNLPDPDITGEMVDSLEIGGKKVYRKTLAEVIGSRARSRLLEMCRVVLMPAVEDYRVQRAR